MSNCTHEDAQRQADDARKSRERQELIAANLGLAGLMARQYRGIGVAFKDLVAIGCVGLCRAADLFDPTRGVKFSTYACHAARREIQRELEMRGRDKNVMFERAVRRSPALEFVADDGRDDDEDIDREGHARRLWWAIEQLPERDQIVIRGRMAEETLSAIGVRLGLTKERVRQIEKRAHEKIRALIRREVAA